MTTIAISEILYNAESSEITTQTQFIELVNVSGGSISLENWTIDDEDGDGPNTLPNVTLAAGEIAVIAGSSAADFEGAWGTATGYTLISLLDLSQTMFNTSNSPSSVSEVVQLRDASGTLIDEVNYDDSNPWPSDSPDGVSIYLTPSNIDTASNDNGANWARSTDGTDGAFSSTPSGVWNAVEVGSPGFVAGFGGGGGTTLAIAATDANKAEGDSGTTPFTFTVTRSGDTSGSTSVDFATLDGTAVAGDDYTSASGTLTFAPGETSKTISIDVLGDTTDNSDEFFDVLIFQPTGGATITTASATGTIVNDEISLTPIYDIQGDGDNFTDEFYKSPLEGQQVTTSGIVTAIATVAVGGDIGFFIQDATGDNNDDTSDGIFVVSGASVAIGNEVQVSGTVVEEFEQTEIDSVTSVTVTGSGSITPIVLGSDRVPPTEIVDDAGSLDYDVTRDGRDFWESLEGMLVTLPDAVATSLTRTFSNGADGEFYAIANQGTGATGANARGGITISEDTSPNNPIGADLNPERIQIDNDLATDSYPTVEVGELFGDITGVINYDFNDYAISPLTAVTATTASPLTPETTTLVGTSTGLTIANYNVENLDPNDSDGDTDIADGKFDDIAAQIATNLAAPDIIALAEVQDNSGSTNDGTTSASTTLQTLIAAISNAGGPTYSAIDNTFITDGASGGQPGGNIRVAFLYNDSRVDLVGGSVQPVGDQDPGSPFNGSRLPLAADFTFNGETVTVIANHFSSKGGSDPLFGEDQPPENGSLDERNDQATEVNNFVANALAADANANIVALGDFNEFQFFSPLDTLETNLTNLTETLPETDRYTFNFEGNSQALDHVLATSAIAANAEYDIVHVNTEFADQAADHDPAIARFDLGSTGNQPPIAVNDIISTIVDAPVTVQVLANDSDLDGDPLALSIDSNPSNGTAIVNGSEIEYTPATSFVGRDTFKYQIDDGNGGTDIALVIVDVADNLVINGTQNADRLVGGLGNDTINGLEDNDVLIGRAGNDTLNGGDGKDRLDGQLGDDILNGDAGKDQLRGREGSDILNGGAGNDFLIGVNKNSATPGLDSIDVLAGGTGRDRFILGNQSTRFYLDSTDGSDDYAEITDFESGIDIVELNGGAGDYSFTFDGNDTAIAFGGDLVANVLGVNFSSADATFV